MGVIKEAIYLEVWFTCWVRVPIIPQERGRHTYIVFNTVSVPHDSLLTIAQLTTKKVGISTGTNVEEGRAAPPVRERYKFNPVYGSSNRASFSGHYQVPIKIK